MQFRRLFTVAATLVLAPLFIACSEASDLGNEAGDAAVLHADAATSDVADAAPSDGADAATSDGASNSTDHGDSGVQTQADASTDLPVSGDDAATDAATSNPPVDPDTDAALSEGTGDGGATEQPGTEATGETSDMSDAGPVEALDAAVTDAG